MEGKRRGGLHSLREVIEIVQGWRSAGERIAFTNGCFDILHVGHIRTFEFARAGADRLVVGLNSDSSVRRLKGPDRPVNNEKDRAEIIRALRAVDLVVLFNEDTPLETILALRPDLLVKGGEYGEGQIVGEPEVLSWGGQVLRAPMIEGFSTTGTILKMKGSSQ